MKKLCYVDKFKSIPLLYPEGVLFPYLHWKYRNGKCSIVGAIPSSLFNSCCIEEGLRSIQKHISTRLISPSNDMGSDPRDICHCYDVLENLAAPRNDTRLDINWGLTVSEDKHGSLVIRGSVYHNILGSVDIKQTMKNIYTSQKQISSYYF